MPKNNSERILEYSSYVSEAKRFAVIILALSFSVCLLSLLKIHINSITNSKFEGEVIKDDQKTSSNQLVLESGFVESDDGLQKVRSNFSYAVIKDLNLSDEINLENVNSTLCKSSNLVSTSSCSNIVSGYAVIFRKQREVLFDGGVAMKICEYKIGRCDNVNSNTLKINSDSAVFVGSVFGAFVNVNDLQNKFGGGISFTGDNITLIKRDSSRLGRDYVAKSSLGSVIKSFNEHYLLNSSSFVANTSGGAKSIDAAYTNGVLNIKDRKKFAFYDIRSKNMFFKHNAVSEIGTVLLDGDHSKVEKISADGSRTNIDSKKRCYFTSRFSLAKLTLWMTVLYQITLLRGF